MIHFSNCINVLTISDFSKKKMYNALQCALLKINYLVSRNRVFHSLVIYTNIQEKIYQLSVLKQSKQMIWEVVNDENGSLPTCTNI